MRKRKNGLDNKVHYSRIILSLVLALCMAISVPVGALAAEGVTVSPEEQTEVSVTISEDPAADDQGTTDDAEITNDQDAADTQEPADDQNADGGQGDAEDQGGNEDPETKTGVVEEDGAYYYYSHGGEKQTTEGKIE